MPSDQPIDPIQRGSPIPASGQHYDWLIRQTKDPLFLRYLGWYRREDVRIRITAAAAMCLRKMNGRRAHGFGDFEHELRDLINHAWRLLLQARPDLENPQAFTEAFINSMKNYERARRRRHAGRVLLDDDPSALDGNTPSAEILHFPSPERTVAGRHALAKLEEAVEREAPDLKPLLSAFQQGHQQAAEQVLELRVPANRIYEMRRRLKHIANRILRPDDQGDTDA